jgi:hypothetical protein
VDNVDRLSGTDQPARSIFKNEPIPVYGDNPYPFITIGKESIDRCLNLDPVAQAELGIGRDGGANHP